MRNAVAGRPLTTQTNSKRPFASPGSTCRERVRPFQSPSARFCRHRVPNDNGRGCAVRTARGRRLTPKCPCIGGRTKTSPGKSKSRDAATAHRSSGTSGFSSRLRRTTAKRQKILCYARPDGRLLWQYAAPNPPARETLYKKNTFASSTPVTDGRRDRILRQQRPRVRRSRRSSGMARRPGPLSDHARSRHQPGAVQG